MAAATTERVVSCPAVGPIGAQVLSAGELVHHHVFQSYVLGACDTDFNRTEISIEDPDRYKRMMGKYS